MERKGERERGIKKRKKWESGKERVIPESSFRICPIRHKEFL